MTIEPGAFKTPEDKLVEKDYHRPQLIVYGSIRELTQRNGGVTGMNDGGAGNDKTSF